MNAHSPANGWVAPPPTGQGSRVPFGPAEGLVLGFPADALEPPSRNPLLSCELQASADSPLKWALWSPRSPALTRPRGDGPRRERQQRWPPLACESLILGLWSLETLAPAVSGYFCFGSLTSAPPPPALVLPHLRRGQGREQSPLLQGECENAWCLGRGGGRGNESSREAFLGLSFPFRVMFHQDWSSGSAGPSQTTTQSR